jgi:hypothetical protein
LSLLDGCGLNKHDANSKLIVVISYTTRGVFGAMMMAGRPRIRLLPLSFPCLWLADSLLGVKTGFRAGYPTWGIGTSLLWLTTSFLLWLRAAFCLYSVIGSSRSDRDWCAHVHPLCYRTYVRLHTVLERKVGSVTICIIHLLGSQRFIQFPPSQLRDVRRSNLTD